MYLQHFVFFFCLQILLSCQQGQDIALPSASNSLPTNVVEQKETISKPKIAANIIYQSKDGGQTWSDVSAGLPEKFDLWSTFANENELFLGTNNGIYNANSVTAFPKWEKEVMLGGEISKISAGKDGLYACVYKKGLFYEVPNTGIWLSIHNSLQDKSVNAIYETPDGAVLIGCETGIFKTENGGNTWKKVSDAEFVYGITASNGVIVCGTYNGLLRSTDNGENWDWTLTEDGTVQKVTLFDGNFVAITRGMGSAKKAMNDPKDMANRLHISKDAGKTWERLDKSLALARIANNAEKKAVTWAINDVAQVDKYLFCSLDTGIFRSADGGKTWENVFPSTERSWKKLLVSGKVIYALNGGGC
jgi:photosystem II stability/assembly factor-like uncharacterized protein